MKRCYCLFILVVVVFSAQVRAECWMWKKADVEIPQGMNHQSPLSFFFDKNAGKIAAILDSEDGVALWHFKGTMWSMDWQSQPEVTGALSEYIQTYLGFYEACNNRIMIIGHIFCGPECGYAQIFELVPGRGWVPVAASLPTDIRLEGLFYYSYDEANRVLIMYGYCRPQSGQCYPVTVEFSGSEFSVYESQPYFELDWQWGMIGSDPESGKTVFVGRYERDFDGVERFGTLEYSQGQWIEIAASPPPWPEYYYTAGLFYVPQFHGLLSCSGRIGKATEWIYSDSRWHIAPIENDYPNCWAVSGSYDEARSVFVTYNDREEEMRELVKAKHCRPISHP